MKKLVSWILVALVLTTVVFPVTALAEAGTNDNIMRKPITRTETYNPSASVNNEYVNGTFHATATIKYQTQGGGYSIAYCEISDVYFSGVVRTDFASKITAFHSSDDGAGHVTIGFKYQVKYEKNGVTYYSDMMTAYSTFTLYEARGRV